MMLWKMDYDSSPYSHGANEQVWGLKASVIESKNHSDSLMKLKMESKSPQYGLEIQWGLSSWKWPEHSLLPVVFWTNLLDINTCLIEE